MWIVQADCGDYYCDGQHLLGVFTNEVKVDEVIAEWLSQSCVHDAGKFEIKVDTTERTKNIHGKADGTLTYFSN